jgi:hypothetical protein
MKFFTDDIPGGAKLFLSLVMALGSVVLAYSLYTAFTMPSLMWLTLVVLTLLVSLLPVRIPCVKVKGHAITITASDVFTYTSILLYSPEVAACVALMDGCLGSLKTRKPYKIAFNLTQMPLVTFVVGHLFYGLQRQPAPMEASSINASNVPMLFFSLAVSAAFYFALNSGMIALAISWVNQIRFWEVWKRQFLWATPANFASASAACVIFLKFGDISYYAIGLVIPVVIVVYQIYSMRCTLSKSAAALG